MPPISASEISRVSDAASKANDNLLSIIGDASELARSFNSVIESNFDSASVKRLVELSLIELEHREVADNVDTLLGSVPAGDDGTSLEEKLERIIAFCYAHPTKSVGAAIIAGLMLLHFLSGTPETAKLVDLSAIITILYSALVRLNEEANKPPPESA